MTTAYYPSADGQAERTNQTVETALRCLLVGKYEENWDSLLMEVEYALNTSENSSTKTTPYESLYGVKPREFLQETIPSTDPIAESFLGNREAIRSDTMDAIRLAEVKIAIRYDEKHRIPNSLGSVYLKLAKTGDSGSHIPKHSSPSTKKVRPFKILDRISPLSYKLELPATMRIYPVISVVYYPRSFPQRSPTPSTHHYPRPGGVGGGKNHSSRKTRSP